ncbi:hypothetical protein DSL72_007414 [Monilinia vaccinii-corymbosi]|uniref:Uncharacterized protein n=1 Tax=Monilinia vaccinii-corymbosi TaxID=61207 RepID=A0A8A3PLR6_9HELO|nr:hypothetical protein DSL72_007414 [Monilinia vaccinii-corymbosi]
MPSKQRTFELVDVPKAIRPMTSKQAKKAYQKANRTPRISKAEQKRQDAQELARHRKAYEKEKAAVKAKAAREKKAAKALEQKEDRKRLGIPEPSRHVRASQSRISMFIKQGNKRLRETSNMGDESEDTMCDDLDESPPAKRVAHGYTKGEVETPSKPIAPDDFEYEREPPKKHPSKKNFDDSRDNLAKPIAPDDSEDEFGDFPPLSDNDISFLDIGSMHSNPANAIYGKPGFAGLARSPLHEPAASPKDEQELPQMKNFEREQMSPDDLSQLEDMLESQIHSEAADAARKSDRIQAVSFEKEKSYGGDTRPTTSTSNHPVKDISGERELLWHAPIPGRHDLSAQSIKSGSPLALPKASAAKVSHDKEKNSGSNLFIGRHQLGYSSNQTINKVPLPGKSSRSDFEASAIGLALPKRSLDIGLAASNKDTIASPNKVSSRMSGFGKKVLQDDSFNFPASRSELIHVQPPKYPMPTYLKQQRYPARKSPVQTSKSGSDARLALQERLTNMGPPVLPPKGKLGMLLADPLCTRTTFNSFNLPPSSTQAFLESHLDEFFPSPTQEARELCEDPIIPQLSTSLKTSSAILNHNQGPEDAKDGDLNAVEDDFGVMLSTQELKMFSQDWESANSPPRQGEKKEKENDFCKQIAVTSEYIENPICSQDSFFSSQEFAGLESVSTAKSPVKTTSHRPQAQASRVDVTQYSTPRPQILLTQPLDTSTTQIDPEMDLTPKPRRSPWFKEKPEDKYTKKRFFIEKPEDLEAAAISESKKAWNEEKEETLFNRHNFDDDLDSDLENMLQAALAESKEWDEVYNAVVPTPTPRKSGEKGRKRMDIEEKENQTPSRIIEKQMQASATKNETRRFERVGSVASTDYGDGEDSDWDGVLEGLERYQYKHECEDKEY